jgi:hypothetical protein
MADVWDDEEIPVAPVAPVSQIPVEGEGKRKATTKSSLPFKVKRWLTRNMSGCKKATGYTANEIYEMLNL